MSFSNIINQQKAKDIITGQLKSGKIPHAYLFLGQDGVGRKRFALELSKILNCHNRVDSNSTQACDTCISCTKIERGIHPDVKIIDYQWQALLENKDVEKQKAIKINTIRALQREINLKSQESKWKIFIIEPAEKITMDAANCLLKTLEEPPAQTVLILLALHKDNLPATLVSRTQIVAFSPLKDEQIAELISQKYSVPAAEADRIARISEGSLSFAISRIEEKYEDVDLLWKKITSNKLSAAEILYLSKQYYKNAPKILSEMLLLSKNRFRADPSRFRFYIEVIMNSQKLIEKNVNSQMVLDTLFLRMNKESNANMGE
ncbi:MAG: DNA polymerase III subunit delta' [Endomicrobiales bacterium]|nr:DNA polymerase III subunit delta' [Endomicrobiales bacterium]